MLALCAVFLLSFDSVQVTHAEDSPPVFPRGEEVPVRVMSFNIHHGEGTDAVLDLDRIADVIRSSNADIVGLQEVDNHFRDRSNFEDQAKLLAGKLGMQYAYGANLDQDPYHPGEPRRQYGTAVLSKYPILESQNYYLSSFGLEQRGLLETRINVKGNQIYFYTTHLGTVEQRQTQVEEILAITGKHDGTKIITGDFNSVPSSVPIQMMTSMYQNGFAGMTVHTAPADKPTVQFDYIFTSGDVFLTDPHTVTVNPVASDHLPVAGTVVLKREAPFNNGADN